ncbi:hypothetical protein [Providencia vermicola]|uniref:hypothetical protein n=1 Tax=Providencia vermicola TaxID=333965 RepID=UPI003F75EBC9
MGYFFAGSGNSRQWVASTSLPYLLNAFPFNRIASTTCPYIVVTRTRLLANGNFSSQRTHPLLSFAIFYVPYVRIPHY